MIITADQIPGILERHAKWLRGEDGGIRANLSCANLIGADLSGANLIGADLSGANLIGADLSRAYLSCANLIGADLSGANLIGADLIGADLSGADLSRANLSRADLRSAVYSFASVSFLGHGECGRTLTALRRKEGEAPVLQCGCFYGDQTELRQYIADGPEKYRATRTLALDTVLALLDARNQE
jgi:uncharacterized protein YjbI with pentapeptide repeats